MASLDTSQRKPRRTQGTPSFKYRNRFAYAFLAIGPLLFGLWCLTPMQRITNDKLRLLTHQSEEEKDRRALFEFGAPRRADFIREALKEADDLAKER